MPIRNPFVKRPGTSNGLETVEETKLGPAEGVPGFERVDTVGSKTSAMSIGSTKSIEPAEYKMSVVNDSGVYLPPSPPEKKSFWPRRSNPSNAPTNTTGSLGEIEPFSISRESFDSYRRSFDISARSPIIASETTRQSLDSARVQRLPRSAVGERRFEREPPTPEEGFEDVGLNDEQSKPKRKGFFSKFGDGETGNTSPTASRFHITGRKRGQSGQGAELGSIERPGTAGSTAEISEVR